MDIAEGTTMVKSKSNFLAFGGGVSILTTYNSSN